MAAMKPPEEPQPDQQPTEGPTLPTVAAAVQSQPQRQGSPVIGIGASAGELEALTALLQAMPPPGGYRRMDVSYSV